MPAIRIGPCFCAAAGPTRAPVAVPLRLDGRVFATVASLGSPPSGMVDSPAYGRNSSSGVFTGLVGILTLVCALGGGVLFVGSIPCGIPV